MNPGIVPHNPLDADLPVRVTVMFDPATQDPERIDTELAAVVETFGRFVVAGAFEESCPGVTWSTTLGSGRMVVDLNRLPAGGCLAVLARMLIVRLGGRLAMTTAGTPAQRPGRSLLSAAAVASAVPALRAALAFVSQLDPPSSWLCVEVTRHAGIDQALADRLTELAGLWLEVARAGGLSTVAADGSVVPGDVGMDPPQVGFDFWAAQIATDELANGAVSCLLNMFDELARTTTRLDEVTVT